jgi:hypothetical protein
MEDNIISMDVFIVPYTLLCYFTFNGIKLVSGGDKEIASYGLAWVVNLFYLGTVGSVMSLQLIHGWSYTVFIYYAQHILSLLLGYYTFDTIRMVNDKDKGNAVFFVHHFISLLLMFLHVWEVLPLHVGCAFLTLFELSNVLLIPYQLCRCKGWHELRLKLSHPMVFTYVPIRLIAIPLCALLYIPYMHQLHPNMWYFCVSMISSLVVFSVYFAVYIGYRYHLWLLKNKIRS